MDKEKDDSVVDPQERRKVILRPRRVDYPRKDRSHQEEFASEVSPLPTGLMTRSTEDVPAGAGAKGNNRAMGIAGVVLGIAGLFFWSIILGPIAAVLGYFAYAKGRKTAGAWAMGLGLVATLSYFVMIPFVR